MHPIVSRSRLLGRPTYSVHVSELMFYHGFFFFRSLISELAERNSRISGHMVGSKCELKIPCPKSGVSLPLQIGAQNHLCDDFTI